MKSLLFQPFEKYSEKTLLLLGIIFTLIASFIAYAFNIRFDGVLDVHIVSDALWYQTLIDNLINIFCLIIFLYSSAKYINKKTRIIDIITTSIIARIPLYLLPLINIKNTVNQATEDIIQLINPELINEIPISSLLIVTGFGIIAILFVVWFIALLFNGFKVASNAKGKFSVILFSISLILAEILSKSLIFQFN